MQLIVISKSASKIQNFFVLYIFFFLLKFVGTVCFVFFLILSHAITESSIILAKYLPFLELHKAGFQIGFQIHYDVNVN